MLEDFSGVIPVRPRVLAAGLLGVALALGSATAAVAFTAQPGFSATTYASGYPTGAPVGVAFVGTNLYTADPVDNGLYATAVSGTLVRIGTIVGAPTALAAFGPSLYALQSATNTIVQVDPATGSVLATLGTDADFGGHAVSGIATDPRNGDLYVSTAPGWTYRIPALAPRTPELAFIVNGYPGVTAYGIALASDGSIYIAVEGVGANGIRQITTSLAQSPIGPDYLGARGLGVIPGYIFANNTDGSILKIVMPAGTGSTAPALTGGASGGPAAIGADGCFYAAQGAAVIRLASADGSCNLANAAPPPPPPMLGLTNTSANLPLIGNGLQTFVATLANVPNPNGLPVTFKVARGTSSTTTVVISGPNGMATFGYSAATPGTDVIAASAVVNGTPVVSNEITVTWLRAVDSSSPTITATVTGDHNAGSFFACPNVVRSTPTNMYCGWFTTPPTIHFTVTPNGPSGLDPTTSCPAATVTINSLINGTPITCGAQNGDLRGATSLTVWLQVLMSPPTITAGAATSSGSYLAGTPTNQNVTVTFACASDPALLPTGISSCTPPITVSSEGTTATVTGTAVDLAGTARSVTFGPIVIDRTAPVVTATMKTATDLLLYTPGTPTTQNVIVTFTCTDTVDPDPTCPGPLTVTSSQTVSTSSTDHAGNTATYPFGQVVIDRSGPTVSPTVTPTPDRNGNNALTATVNLTATDPSGIGSITYSAAGAQTVAPWTVAATGSPLSFTVPISLTAIGDTTVTYSARDTLGNVSATGTITVHILATQPTTLAITSAPSLTQGVPVSVRLLALGTAPVSGQTVTFTAGTASAVGVTDASGTASAVLNLAPGVYTLTASFGGTSAYVASTAGPQTIVVSAATQFVIWGGNPGGVQIGQRVVFWGEHWSDQVVLAEKLRVKDFKGWADAMNGSVWTSKGGDSKPPETIATYISVIITTSVERVDEKTLAKGDKAKVAGNIVGHAILRVDSPYKDDPGKPVYGVVVAVVR